MAQFNAATAVEAMDYDFSAFGGSKGTIPEPSNGQVTTFFDTVASLGRKVGMDKDPENEKDREDLAEMLAGLDDNQVQQMEEDLASAIHDLCSGTPSADEYKNLPFRVQGAFVAWLAGELRPESQRPATKR